MAEPLTATSPALGHHLPQELLNAIYELIVEEDEVAYVLPWPIAAITISRPVLQRKRKRTSTSTSTNAGTAISKLAITSTHPLMRTCRNSRDTYHSLFRAKTLDMDVRSILVSVLDLNFDYFLDDLVAGACKRSSQAREFFLEREFMVQLVLTQEFLRKPTSGNLERYIDRLENDGQTDARPYSFHYYTTSIPAESVDKLREVFKYFVFLRRGVPGPELTKLMDDMRETFEGRLTPEEEIHGLPM